MKCLLGKSILWLLGALLLFVIFSAARIAAADLLSKYAGNEMAAWSTGTPDSSGVAEVSRVLGAARLVAPGKPDIYELLARLDLVRSDMTGTAESSIPLREGISLIRQAISRRPASAYDWAILLRLKQKSSEYDAEFRRGLERAVTLGPWEPEVQYIVADTGLSAWPSLSGTEREMVRMNFVRGMKRQASRMIYIAQTHRNDCSREFPPAGCRQ